MNKCVFLTFVAIIAATPLANAASGYPMIRDTRKMRGSVTFVNAQKRIKIADGLDKTLAALDKEFRWDIRVTNVTDVATVPAASSLRKKLKTTAAVFFIDVPDLPALSAYPDLHLAFVNVAPLAADNAKERQMMRRIRTESLRAFAFAFGAGFSQYKAILMSPAESLSELDIIPTTAFYPYDTLVSLRTVAENLGLSPYSNEYYETACQEGWAPAPVNAEQKAVWDKVHAVPTAPIVIKPEPAKGK